MKLLMLRHASTERNEKEIMDDNSVPPEIDTNLSDNGKKQAKELIEKLRNYNLDLFIVSPLKRTLETLKPFLETLSNPRVIEIKLTSERNVGEFAGHPNDSIKKYCEKHNIDRVSFRPKGGESILDLYERAKRFLNYLRKNFNEEKILICGHSNFLTCLKIAIKGEDIYDYYSFRHPENDEIWEFEVEPYNDKEENSGK